MSSARANSESSDLARNLRLLCSFEKSVSEICRAIAINRQQFNKYLSGASQPSARNLRKICEHFHTHQSELYLPHAEFAELLSLRGYASDRLSEQAGSPEQLLKRAFPGNRRALSRYLGYYLTHSHALSWEGYILRTLVCLYEREGMILNKTISRVKDPKDGTLFMSKYDGYVSWLGNSIFLIEFQNLAQDAVVETILHPDIRSQSNLLHGLSLDMSSKRQIPYVTRTIWKFLGATIEPRSTLQSLGVYPPNTRALDPQILQTLNDSQIYY